MATYKEPSIPLSREHLEAIQADTDRRREDLRATLSSEEKTRLTAIEQASALLEAAKVPFLLFGDVKDSDTDSNWFQFNKLDYNLPESGESLRNAIIRLKQRFVQGLGCSIMGYFGGIFGAGSIGVYGQDGIAMFGYDIKESGRAQFLWPKESPTE